MVVLQGNIHYRPSAVVIRFDKNLAFNNNLYMFYYNLPVLLLVKYHSRTPILAVDDNSVYIGKIGLFNYTSVAIVVYGISEWSNSYP